MTQKPSLIGNILAIFFGAVFLFSMIHQFFLLAVGDMHTGGLYGNRGNAIMYDNE